MVKIRNVKKTGGGVRITGIRVIVRRPKKPSMWNPLNWIPSVRKKKTKPTGKDI